MKIKMIWDFRGAEALPTAKHHAIHLKEFALKHELQLGEEGTEELTSMHSIAYLIIEQSDMILVRDALKPHRAEEA